MRFFAEGPWLPDELLVDNQARGTEGSNPLPSTSESACEPDCLLSRPAPCLRVPGESDHGSRRKMII